MVKLYCYFAKIIWNEMWHFDVVLRQFNVVTWHWALGCYSRVTTLRCTLLTCSVTPGNPGGRWAALVLRRGLDLDVQGGHAGSRVQEGLHELGVGQHTHAEVSQRAAGATTELLQRCGQGGHVGVRQCRCRTNTGAKHKLIPVRDDSEQTTAWQTYLNRPTKVEVI